MDMISSNVMMIFLILYIFFLLVLAAVVLGFDPTDGLDEVGRNLRKLFRKNRK